MMMECILEIKQILDRLPHDLITKLIDQITKQTNFFEKFNDIYVLHKYNSAKQIRILDKLSHEVLECYPIQYRDKFVYFYIPFFYRDYIQKRIVLTDSFFELHLLEKFISYVKEIKGDGAKIYIDAGANIGNHTIYFSIVGNAELVYCIEPQKILFDILNKNIILNSINAQLYNHLASSSAASFEFGRFDPQNTGATIFKRNNSSGYRSIMLDTICTEGPVAALKIDVEGHEMEVIKGAASIIERDHPVIWTEMWELNNDLVKFLSDRTYSMIKISRTDYFFV